MNDEFDDPSYDDIRALLGAAKADDPIPDDVVARLDATLADLTADRVPNEQVVVPLRRRRLAPRMLVAAAAIVVVGAGGVAVNQVIGDNETGTASSSADSSVASSEVPPESAPVPTPASNAPGAGGGGGTAGRSPASQLNGLMAAQFKTSTFARDAAAFVDPLVGEHADKQRSGNLSEDLGAPSTDSSTGSGTTSPESTTDQDAGGKLDTRNRLYFSTTKGLQGAAGKACGGPTDPGGPTYLIKLDGKPAVLVVRPPADGTQLVAAWSCDGSAVLASATVPVH